MNRGEQKPGEYVAGFLYSPDMMAVALVEKLKPAWQRGKLNGVGGSIEEGETPYVAMRREFEEEAGVLVLGWQHFRTEHYIHGSQVKVHFFAAFATGTDWRNLTSRTDEQIHRVPLAGLFDKPERLIYNLPYLIPMGLILLRQPIQNVPKP